MNVFRKIFRNQEGMTLVEILISVGLAVGVSVAGLKLIQTTNQSSNNFEASNELISIEKSIGSYLFSKNGCKQLISSTSLSPEQSFSINRSEKEFDRATGLQENFNGIYQRVIFTEGQTFKNVQIKDMKIESINTLSTNDDSGILTLRLTFLIKKSHETFSPQSKVQNRRILIPVALKANKIVDCQISKVSMYQDIYDKVCSDIFGAGVTSGLTCENAILLIARTAKSRICLDISGKDLNASGNCIFNLAHANKSCSGPRFARGFSSTGSIECQ